MRVCSCAVRVRKPRGRGGLSGGAKPFRPTALGKSNKLIAYELSLSPSTIAIHLLRSRTQLVATLAGLERASRSFDEHVYGQASMDSKSRW
jgi:hypothetical protein